MLPTMGPHGVSNMNALAGKAVQADDVIRFKLAAVEDELGKPLETKSKLSSSRMAWNFALLGFWAEKQLPLATSISLHRLF